VKYALVVLAACSSSPAEVQPGWMSTIDDTANLASLSIPGTHDSAALYEPAPGTAKCQNLTLAEQVAAGVRYFDIRCRHLDDMFAIYHGPVDEQLDFDQVTQTMLDFLDAHPTETVMMSVKEESEPNGDTQSFEQTFQSYVAKHPDRWYLGDVVPALGDVRGKIVLVRRFPATTTPLGLDASAWADNATFTLNDPDATLRIEDQYLVTSTDTKWTEITSLLGEATASTGGTLYLDYTSGYESHDGVPNILDVANAINPMIDTFLDDPANAHRHLGVMAMDLITEHRAVRVAGSN
jgi:1-phosphatidylinositol phosphodiesterase